MLSVAGIKLELTKSTEAVITNDVPHFLSVVPKSNTDVVPGTNPPLTITFPYPPTPSILLELIIVSEAVVAVRVFTVPVSAAKVSILAVPSMYKSFHSLVDVPKSLRLSWSGIKLELI